MNLQECFLALAQFEEEGAKFYQEFSAKCSEQLKSVVITFSKEEIRHKEFMLEFSKDEKLIKEQLDEKVETLFKIQINNIMDNNKDLNLTSEKEFFRFSLKLEKYSIEIYSMIGKLFESDSYEHNIFEELIKEERKHMLFILNKLYELT